MDQLSRAEEVEQKRIYWKEHINQWQQTGLTQAEYCRQHHLKHHQMVYWKKRFLKTESEVSFVSMKLDDLMDLPAQVEHSSLFLVIDDHFKIEVRAGFDIRLLQKLIHAVRGLP